MRWHSQMQADDLQFDDASLDLATMVRVMHHIPEPSAEFAEIARVLKPGGTALIEVANYGHFKNRRRYKKEGKPLPTEPVSIRTVAADVLGVDGVDEPHVPLYPLALPADVRDGVVGEVGRPEDGRAAL